MNRLAVPRSDVPKPTFRSLHRSDIAVLAISAIAPALAMMASTCAIAAQQATTASPAVEAFVSTGKLKFGLVQIVTVTAGAAVGSDDENGHDASMLRSRAICTLPRQPGLRAAGNCVGIAGLSHDLRGQSTVVIGHDSEMPSMIETHGDTWLPVAMEPFDEYQVAIRTEPSNLSKTPTRNRLANDDRREPHADEQEIISSKFCTLISYQLAGKQCREIRS